MLGDVNVKIDSGDILTPTIVNESPHEVSNE
jgi:hypothetical protein